MPSCTSRRNSATAVSVFFALRSHSTLRSRNTVKNSCKKYIRESMAIDCDDVLSNITYSCANPWGQNCTSQDGFQLAKVWNYTRNIQAACASDDRLYLADNGFASPQNASLTQAACVAIVGLGMAYYSSPNIWGRLTSWKFPLLQLVASFPRPPLSFTVECFAILHLLGDPIDTIRNLLYKLSNCQDIARFWQKECKLLLQIREDTDHERDLKDRDWKALALVTDAYGEWNETDSARWILHNALYADIPFA